MNNAKKNKKVIVFEGIDGAGKSTQARLLYFALKKIGRQVELHHFPSESIIGKFVRGLLENGKFDLLDSKTKTLLTAADFYSQYNINNNYDIVIFDRYVYSSYVSNNKLDREWIKMIHEYAPDPDLIFFLEGNPALIRNRKGADFGAKNIKRQNDFFIRYKKIFQEIPNIRIDCEKNIQVIHQEILKKVIENFNI